MVFYSSTIIQDIDTMRRCGLASLAFFYYDFREGESQGLRGLLSSMLLQICGQSDSYCDILSSFYLGHHNGVESPTDDELIQCLKDVMGLAGQAPIFLVLDALDECPPVSDSFYPRELLTLLKDLVGPQLLGSRLRICITSRPSANIEHTLEPLTFRYIFLHDESGQKEDIKNYIKSFLNTNNNMQRWTQKYKKLVIDFVTERAEGS
jgi:NACHT domain